MFFVQVFVAHLLTPIVAAVVSLTIPLEPSPSLYAMLPSVYDTPIVNPTLFVDSALWRRLCNCE